MSRLDTRIKTLENKLRLKSNRTNGGIIAIPEEERNIINTSLHGYGCGWGYILVPQEVKNEEEWMKHAQKEIH